tara:strand:- start:720 stop:1034 length:315 start_codon:yes stop_codon:yes gene_type:complete
MKKWSKSIEDDLTHLIKDWLKNKNMSQSDLKEALQASSSRMQAILEVLEREYYLGGISKVAERLCSIEDNWSNNKNIPKKETEKSDPFNQLDLLLEELQEDIGS